MALISPPMAKVAIGFCIAGSVPVHRRLAQSRVAPPARSRSRDACQVEKEKPRRGGGKFVPVRRNFQDSRGSGGDRVAVQLRLACWTRSRCPGFKAKENSTIIPLSDVWPLAEGVSAQCQINMLMCQCLSDNAQAVSTNRYTNSIIISSPRHRERAPCPRGERTCRLSSPAGVERLLADGRKQRPSSTPHPVFLAGGCTTSPDFGDRAAAPRRAPRSHRGGAESSKR